MPCGSWRPADLLEFSRSRARFYALAKGSLPIGIQVKLRYAAGYREEDVRDRLKEKVALVSGAGSSGPGWGNGKATAVLFAREGAKVLGGEIGNPRRFSISDTRT
jgi:hypothetical protein